MKKILVAVSLLTLLITGCKKQNGLNPTTENAIAGIWQAMAVRNSPGSGPGEWMELPVKDRHVIYLYADGSATGLNGFTKYRLENENTVIFKLNNSTDVQFSYTLTGSNELNLSGGCIESCETRYQRVN